MLTVLIIANIALTINLMLSEKRKMWFPIEWLPEEYHKEPYKNFNGLCVEVPLVVAMKYRTDKLPYVLSVSSDLY
jgi:hypothetical protein